MLTSANYYRYMEKSEVIFCDTISCSITLPKAVNITYVKTNFRSGVRGGGRGDVGGEGWYQIEPRKESFSVYTRVELLYSGYPI